MKKFITGILFILLLSCSHGFTDKTVPWDKRELPIGWIFDCSFPERFKSDVRYAFQYWDSKTKAELFQELPDCIPEPDQIFPTAGVIVITYSHLDAPTDYNKGGVKKVTLGNTFRWKRNDAPYMGSVKIRFYRKWFKRNLGFRASLARHEVGHALGLSHNNDKNCLMYHLVLTNQLWKSACQEELNEFHRHY